MSGLLKLSSLGPAARVALQLMKRIDYGRFEKNLFRASTQQPEWLLNRIRKCEQTGFGKQHGFQKIRTIEDFRQQVPVAEYDHFKPYIDDVAAGKTEALIPASEKLHRFTITTGSSGTPKLNPVTDVWLKEYKKAWGIWGLKMFTDHPDWIGRNMLQMAGTWEMGKTPGGYSISMISALLARSQSPFLKPFYAIPSELNDIADPVPRYYTALRLCITQEIGWIILMNPGTLIRLAEIGDEFRDDLIRDIHDGTLSDRFEVPVETRKKLAPRFRPNRAGAKWLEEIVTKSGHLWPKDYWKQPVIAGWLGGTAGFQSRYLADYFGASPLRDMGLVSSEGRHTIPIEDDKPQGVPSIESGFYEFLPVEEINSAQPNCLMGHELQDGEQYYLVMTTSAGYYRFHIGDIVQCNGFHGEAPLLEFIQKGSRVGDLEGEKVTEHQVLEAAHNTAKKLGINLGHFTAVPRRLHNEHPRYDFLIEQADVPEESQAAAFLQTFDEELAALNFLWKARRKEGTLAAPHLLQLGENAWEKYIIEEVARRGTGDYQYKHPGLVQEEGWINQFHPQRVTIR